MDFRTAGTTPEALRRELTRRAVARIAVEAYAQAGWVHDLCADLDLGAIVASSAGATWRWKREKRKTAREDALKLASLVSIAEFDPVAVPRRPPVGVADRWRKRLVSKRVRDQNRVRGLLVSQRLAAPGGAKAWTAVGLAGIGQWARPLTACDRTPA